MNIVLERRGGRTSARIAVVVTEHVAERPATRLFGYGTVGF